MIKGQQGFSREQGAVVLENLAGMSNEVDNLKNTCSYFRTLLDEGTYKLNSALKVIDNIKIREQGIMVSGGESAVLQQMNEEQIDNLLELLKSPAFQQLARQLLLRWLHTVKK